MQKKNKNLLIIEIWWILTVHQQLYQRTWFNMCSFRCKLLILPFKLLTAACKDTESPVHTWHNFFDLTFITRWHARQCLDWKNCDIVDWMKIICFE